MALSLVYRVFVSLLTLLVRGGGSVCAKDVELLALRQQLTILQRQVGRPKLRASDRALLAAAGQVLSPARRRGMLVTPQTPLAGAAVAARAEAPRARVAAKP